MRVSGTARARAIELFDKKRQLVARLVDYRCRLHRLSVDLGEDWLQASLLALWQACLNSARSGVDIDCEICIRKGAIYCWRRDRRDKVRRGCRRLLSLNAGKPDLDRDDSFRSFDPPYNEPSIHVDGIRLTMADARMDAADLVELAANGITASEAARRHGLARRVVIRRARQLGGFYFPTLGWRFPDAASDADSEQTGRADEQTRPVKPGAGEWG